MHIKDVGIKREKLTNKYIQREVWNIADRYQLLQYQTIQAELHLFPLAILDKIKLYYSRLFHLHQF